MEAISGAGDAVSDMKYFKAKDKPPAAVSRDAVEAADVYVGIIGWDYGTRVPHQPDVISFTEYEFEVATRARKPRLIFLVPPRRGRWARTLPTGSLAERQRAFRARLKTGSGLTIKEVGSPDRLSEELSRALNDLGAGREWFFAVPSLDGFEVPRPAELDAVMGALCDEERGVCAVVLWGPGGFGKSRSPKSSRTTIGFYAGFRTGCFGLTSATTWSASDSLGSSTAPRITLLATGLRSRIRSRPGQSWRGRCAIAAC